MYVSNTNIKREKNKHLTLNDRNLIAIRIKDKYSISAIAKELNCSRTTIYNELHKGTVHQIKDIKDVYIYYPDTGDSVYKRNRYRKNLKYISCIDFIKEVEKLMFNNKWSIDASVNHLIKSGKYNKINSVCTKTIYNYIDLGLMKIKNIDLPFKVKYKPKTKRLRKNKKILGDSIEKRDKSILKRKEFGHWEIDTVIGKTGKKEAVLLTLVERKTRFIISIKIKDKTVESVMQGIKKLEIRFASKFKSIFKSITSDNGSEFSSLSKLNNKSNIYYTHPYSAYERGTNERHNGLIRRFIPKGKSINNISIEVIDNINKWCNTLPRKILSYKTPEELFMQEIYAL